MTPLPKAVLKADHVEKDDKGNDVVMNPKGTTVYPTNAYLFFAQGMLNANLENGAIHGGSTDGHPNHPLAQRRSGVLSWMLSALGICCWLVFALNH